MGIDDVVGVMPVLERHRFDTAALERYMAAHVEGFSGKAEVEQFRTGQSNPTYRVTSGSRRYVLRRKPPGELLPSAHAVDREYRVITGLQESGVPVPRTYALCEDPEIIGTAFYVMDYVEGRILWDPWLPDAARDERPALFDEMNRVMALLHQVDYEQAGLGSFGRPGNYFERQISRWTRQYRASETERIEAMERLIAWLPDHIPAGDESSIVHGDFRSANVIFHPDEPRITAVLDWELSTIGHPLGDFAYHCMHRRLPQSVDGMAELDLAEHNIPPEDEYVAAYCRRTGRAGIEDWDFYVIFNMFRLAAINQGIVARALAGTASSEQAMEKGLRARGIAETGLRELERIGG